ncbi:achelase-1-like [Bicyclus anynana]|uniref:Achelase-1-like n=1 Tax=Bicyclus anynana TaxID=110368 RepID=A0ABM3LZ95_BICAN|nr:achelase-1-like [Bicyclus anynana]
MTTKMLIVFAIIICVIKNINAQSRIAGGQIADITQYPFATSLLYNQEATATNFEQVCGGTILTNSAILSAASCFFINNQITPPSTWRARVGSTSSITGGLQHIISAITTHDEYSTTTRVNDVAILRTAVNIAFSASVQPAYIAGGAYRLSLNDQVMAIGWGATVVSTIFILVL